MAMSVPPPIVVYVEIEPTKQNQLRERLINRIGAAHTEDGARKLIQSDRKSMTETYGNMIEAPGVKGRTYHAFKASWERIDL